MEDLKLSRVTNQMVTPQNKGDRYLKDDVLEMHTIGTFDIQRCVRAKKIYSIKTRIRGKETGIKKMIL